MNLLDASARDIRDGVTGGQLSAVDVAPACLDRIATVNPTLNAFNLVDAERALSRAEAVDRRRAEGRALGPLAGVPIALKDNMNVRGMRTTASSRILEHFVPPYDATVVQRLENAGAIIVGKTNCDEFAMGSSTENSAFGPVRNPVALDRVPGGSSGGSAAAVAQGTAVVALGSDTGGSVRQPASFCGVVGITPTYGRVSRYGLTAYASSLDHIGPFARSVKDAATLLSVIAGRDLRDATSAEAPVPDYSAQLDGNVKGLKLGLPREYLKDLTGESSELLMRGVETLKSLGCDV